MGGGYFPFFTENRPQKHKKHAILHPSQANGGARAPPAPPPWLRYCSIPLKIQNLPFSTFKKIQNSFNANIRRKIISIIFIIISFLFYVVANQFELLVKCYSQTKRVAA